MVRYAKLTDSRSGNTWYKYTHASVPQRKHLVQTYPRLIQTHPRYQYCAEHTVRMYPRAQYRAHTGTSTTHAQHYNTSAVRPSWYWAWPIGGVRPYGQPYLDEALAYELHL
eukprot:2371386-Rhodomonas_salina.3